MWGKRPEMIVHEQDPYNAETSLAGLLPPVTPVADFYVRNHGPVPEVEELHLVVDGLVERPLELGLDELQALEQHTVVATLQCAGNRRAGFLPVRDIPGEAPWGPGATSTAEWTGVRLADLLGRAGLLPEAAHIGFEGPDVSQLADPPQPFGGSVPRAVALGPDVLVALAMNGEPLPRVHGGPARIVVPGHIGARSVKWVRSITALREPSENHFQETAYRILPEGQEPEAGRGFPLSEVAQNCAILSPREGDQLTTDELTVRGYAMAGGERRVVRVDLSCDGGHSWQQATVQEPVGPHAWQHWRALVTLSPGRCTLVARCWDSTGAVQPESPAALWNTKGYANNSWDVVTVDVAPTGGHAPR